MSRTTSSSPIRCSSISAASSIAPSAPEALLQPNRYEARPDGAVQKLYVDYHLTPARTAGYQNLADRPRLELPFLDGTVAFERSAYPSAGCFFLNADQLAIWAQSPAFLDGDVSYLSPLDSAATLSIMKTFRIYKPVLDQASFLKVLHASAFGGNTDNYTSVARGRRAGQCNRAMPAERDVRQTSIAGPRARVTFSTCTAPQPELAGRPSHRHQRRRRDRDRSRRVPH
jgi:hypothetical protein